jgi:di/tripeptidase
MISDCEITNAAYAMVMSPRNKKQIDADLINRVVNTMVDAFAHGLSEYNKAFIVKNVTKAVKRSMPSKRKPCPIIDSDEGKKKIGIYLKSLDSTLKQIDIFNFNDVVANLEKEKATLVKEVAYQWTLTSKKNVSSKVKAIKAIKSRREALDLGRAKSIATGGRTAA